MSEKPAVYWVGNVAEMPKRCHLMIDGPGGWDSAYPDPDRPQEKQNVVSFPVSSKPQPATPESDA